MEKLTPLSYSLTRGDHHSELPRADLYHRCGDHGSATYEECMFLYALCLVTKPKLIIETGAETGATTLHMALALKHNSLGKLISFEWDERWCNIVNDKLRKEQLSDFGEVRKCAALDGLATINDKIDFALLDTEISMRYGEFQAIKPKMTPGGLVCIHDTSPLHPYRGNVNIRELLKNEKIINIESPKGLTMIQT